VQRVAEKERRKSQWSENNSNPENKLEPVNQTRLSQYEKFSISLSRLRLSLYKIKETTDE
jgi:hypothetical protein